MLSLNTFSCPKRSNFSNFIFVPPFSRAPKKVYLPILHQLFLSFLFWFSHLRSFYYYYYNYYPYSPPSGHRGGGIYNICNVFCFQNKRYLIRFDYTLRVLIEIIIINLCIRVIKLLVARLLQIRQTIFLNNFFYKQTFCVFIYFGIQNKTISTTF